MRVNELRGKCKTLKHSFVETSSQAWLIEPNLCVWYLVKTDPRRL